MKITVAICTWNRADLLDQTLAEMRLLVIPPSVEWELLVVNNNCTDHTDAVIERYREALPLRRLFESKQGLSHARNRALAEAETDWIVFTDDDVLVSRNWLASYCAAISVGVPPVAFLGGEITPWFPSPPDPDLVAAIPIVGSGFCGRDIPASLEIRDAETIPLGANFALNRALLGRQQFDPHLGLQGLGRIAGEEVDLLRRLLAQGLTGRWVPDAGVRHYVDSTRFTLRYLRRHLFDAGRTSVRERRMLSDGARGGLPAWLYRDVIESAAAMLIWKLLGRRRRYLAGVNRFFLRSGMVVEQWFGSGRRNA